MTGADGCWPILDTKCDAIIMDTTFNWREHAINLLSVDFLKFRISNTLRSAVSLRGGEVKVTWTLRLWTALSVV